MFVFSSLQAALQAGFRWSTFLPDEGLHLVELDRSDGQGRRVKAIAFAHPDPDPTD